jgi:hypothetical protein
MLVLHTKSAELFFLFSLYSISQTTHVKTYYYINKNNNNKKRDTCSHSSISTSHNIPVYPIKTNNILVYYTLQNILLLKLLRRQFGSEGKQPLEG